MRSDKFWAWFDEHAAPKLVGRDKTFSRDRTFREMFNFLDLFDRPVHIVETGCLEEPDNWAGNGCSTIQFDRYVDAHPGSRFYSVDIVPEKVELARHYVTSESSRIFCGDSVKFLRGHATLTGGGIDLLYLDASHLDWSDPVPSQLHHLNELMAAMPALHAESMVAVDDSPLVSDSFPHADVGGKGALVAKLMFSRGADLAFLEYQAAWTNPTAKPVEGDPGLRELVDRARRHVEANRIVAASPLYNLILYLTPQPLTPVGRIARGDACAFFARLARALDRKGTAADWYIEALRADPRATDYRIELATKCLVNFGAKSAAVGEMLRAARIEPDHDKVWRILGTLEQNNNNIQGAIEAFDKQIEVSPGNPDAILDRCTIALDVEDYALVKELATKAIGTRREADAWHILGMAAYRQNRHEEAIELIDRALAQNCFDAPLVHWHKSAALESIGRYREAWVEREWRKYQLQDPGLALPMGRFIAPMWDQGWANRVVENGKERQALVHVHAESGAGDNLCCIRYLPRIAELGFKVRYESYEGMEKLIARSFPTVEVVEQAPDYPGGLGIKPFDYHIPIGQLQRAFDTSIEDAVADWRGPYLKADPALVEKYAAKMIGTRNWPQVGLCWSSGILTGTVWLQAYGRHKSMHFDDLVPLVEARQIDTCFYNLQIGPERAQQYSILDVLPEGRPSWDETAALIANLDAVVTVDTSVAHLAGAMGKPVFVMMHTQGSWHFMVERPGSPWNERSPWYPSVRIFRQRAPDQWADVVGRVVEALREPKLAAAE